MGGSEGRCREREREEGGWSPFLNDPFSPPEGGRGNQQVDTNCPNVNKHVAVWKRELNYPRHRL